MAHLGQHTTNVGLKLDDSYLAVAAIDFGIGLNGCAISFKSSPAEILENSLSTSNSLRRHTAVLTNPDGSFNTFGYEAEVKYIQHEPEEGYHLYRDFRTVLQRRVRLHCKN